MFKDVPKNWIATDFDHRFRLNVGLFRHTCAETASQYRDLSRLSSFVMQMFVPHRSNCDGNPVSAEEKRHISRSNSETNVSGVCMWVFLTSRLNTGLRGECTASPRGIFCTVTARVHGHCPSPVAE